MPPKAAERLQKELAAQRARAEALKHLQATGSGPSQRELSQQQQLRQRQTANATSSIAQRKVLGTQPAPTAADKYDPRVRDNTLHAVAMRRAQEMQRAEQIEMKAESFYYGMKETNLPTGWQETVDPASGDMYYWNESTQETRWERPGTEEKVKEESAEPKKDEETLEDDWKEVSDAASGDVYYWNRKTNETTWTRPAPRNVSLAKALEAKAKLDRILKGCGKPTPKVSSSSQADAKSTNQANSSRTQLASSKRPATATQNNHSSNSHAQTNKKQKRAGPKDGRH